MLLVIAIPTGLVAQTQRPNIIYIMTDDMGYGDLSSYGQKDFQTPNIDQLASQGIKLVNAYSAAPLCTPARTAFMTGRYPAKTPVGLFEPLTGNQWDTAVGLTPDYPSIASLLKGAGYQTALVGKWHLGTGLRHSPLMNGFDYFFGIRSGSADYISHRVGGKHDLYENDSMSFTEGYLTDLFSQKAIAYIGRQHKQPFFLAVAFNAPHWPWQAPNDKPYPDSVNFRVGGSPATYAAMMKRLDEGVGNLLQALDAAQLSGNTLVIFTNDNGGERYSNNGGLSNAKGSLWEGGIRVPAFVRWPGRISAGTVTQQVAITMDWSATILAAAGATAHQDFALDGIDLMPVLMAKMPVIERTMYWRTFQRARQKAVLSGSWKYLQDEQGEYLFNLANDQGEKNNLGGKEVAVFNSLKNKYLSWENNMPAPIPLGK